MVNLLGARRTAALYDNTVIHSSDSLREELLGDINDQSQNADIFVELYKRVKRDLKAGKNVILDATGLARKKRMAFIRELKHIDCYKECVFFAVPFEVCCERNEARDRVVPANEMRKMHKCIQVPVTTEGFDIIYSPCINEYCTYYGSAKDKIESLTSFSQDNHHHTLTLGQHCESVRHLMLQFMLDGHIDEEWEDIALRAALLHDIGKETTKVWTTRNGDPTDEAHYFNHENVGAYDSLFYKYKNNDFADSMLAALLIELHMKPYVAYKASKKSLERDKKLLGEDGWACLMALHECDKLSH